MPDSHLKILCIEDDADTCELVTFVFRDAGCEVKTCSQTDCLKLIREENFSAIILDNYFNGLSGVEICREMRIFDQTTPVIFLSGEVRQAEISKAMAAGANAYLTKPADFEHLVSTTFKFIRQT